MLCVNLALLGLLEWGAGMILDRLGLHADNTRIFNAANGRDNSFVVQYDDRLGYRLKRQDTDPARFEDSAGRSVSVAKPGGVFRILCLGGSTTYGVGADRSNSYPAQLEDLLHRVYSDCGIRFEVLNLGVMGYHSWHSRIRFETELAALNPDVVLVMDAVNDLVASTVADDSLAFAQEKERLTRLTNAQGGSGWLASLDRAVSDHSDLYRLLRSLAHTLGQAEKAGAADADAAMRQRIEHFGYRDNMRSLISLIRKAGGECVLVDYPWLAASQPAPDAPEVTRRASTDLYRFGRDYFPAANAALARQGGVAVIDPQPAFDAALAARPSRAGELYFDEIHLTKYGDQLLAAQILDGLRRVEAFARRTAACRPEDSGNAVKLDDPRIHFTNGWPRAGESALPLVLEASENTRRDSDEYPGRVKISPADPTRPAVLRLRADAPFAPQPMPHTAYPALWYPRVSCATDRVEATANGKTVFVLAGTRQCRFTEAAGRFGIDLPALAPGGTVDVRLFGQAQVWLTDDKVFFTGDQTPPGY
ncbi:MAG: SGNH/GDSL hydrolase family protein [Acidobacteriota bacterium]